MTLIVSPSVEINRLHAEARQMAVQSRRCLEGALQAAWQAGRLLLEEKARVRRMGAGAWLFWLEQQFNGTPRTAQRYMRLARLVPDIRLDRGDAGMLLTKVTAAEGINLQEVARHDPQTVARICAFFVLDRGEWPEPWSVGGQLRLIDLEFILARFVSRAADRRWRLDEYAEMTPTALAHAGREAARCGIEPLFLQELTDWHRRFAGDEFAFDFSGHRRGPLISEFLLRALRLRLGLVADILDLAQPSA